MSGVRRARFTRESTVLSGWANAAGRTAASERDDVDPVLQFDKDGQLLQSFGAGLITWPHGIHVDFDGNVWVTDARGDDTRGHQVMKFSSDGEVLMRLGKAGVAGAGNDVFDQPSDVLVAPNGDIFVADGHGTGGNNRIVKFSADGRFIKTWGVNRGRGGRIPRPACAGDGFEGPAVCRGPWQQSRADFRPGRQLARHVDAVRAGRAGCSSTRMTSCIPPIPNRTHPGPATGAGSAAFVLAASVTAGSPRLFPIPCSPIRTLPAPPLPRVSLSTTRVISTAPRSGRGRWSSTSSQAGKRRKTSRQKNGDRPKWPVPEIVRISSELGRRNPDVRACPALFVVGVNRGIGFPLRFQRGFQAV